jgi:hypothetical protein
MMNRSLTLFALAFASVCALGAAFTPISSRSVAFQPARVVAAANNRLSNKQIFRMSEEPTEGEGEVEVAKPNVSADGSFYDDEVCVCLLMLLLCCIGEVIISGHSHEWSCII